MKSDDTVKVLGAVVAALGFQPAGATVERLRAELAGVELAPVRLAGIRELSERYHVSRQAVSNWASTTGSKAAICSDFPAPAIELACGSIYDLDATDAWAARTGRLPKELTIEQEGKAA